MAIIGKAKAVADLGWLRLGGFLAWLIWGGIHIAFLIGFRNRVQVLMSWFWSWLLNARDARLITGPATLEIQTPRDGDFVPDESAAATSVRTADARTPGYSHTS
jgi:NADH dehydrogenase